MTTLSIKDVPEAWAKTLRQRAARHHRSLQGELMAILEAAVIGSESVVSDAAQFSEPALRPLSPVHSSHRKTIGQIAADLRARYPEPLPSGPSSIELIREDRDRR